MRVADIEKKREKGKKHGKKTVYCLPRRHRSHSMGGGGSVKKIEWERGEGRGTSRRPVRSTEMESVALTNKKESGYEHRKRTNHQSARDVKRGQRGKNGLRHCLMSKEENRGREQTG